MRHLAALGGSPFWRGPVIGADGSTRMLGLGGAGEVPPGLGVVGGLAAGLGEAGRDTRARWHGHGGLGAVRSRINLLLATFPNWSPNLAVGFSCPEGPPELGIYMNKYYIHTG